MNFINASSAMPMPSCMLFGFDHAIHYPLHVRYVKFYLLLHFSLFVIYFESVDLLGGKSNCIEIIE